MLAVDDEPTRHAAEELQRYLAEATGATVSITPMPGRAAGTEIQLGWGKEARAAAPDLPPDAFVWRTLDDGPLVIGGPGQGTTCKEFNPS